MPRGLPGTSADASLLNLAARWRRLVGLRCLGIDRCSFHW
jgi:hypothetical protein